MKKCHECGGALTKDVRDHHYVESGLDNVVLLDVPHYACTECGHESVAVPAMSKLHRAIATALAEKLYRLAPQEVRFIRTYLDLTNKRFAELMGVTAEQSSRWMTTDRIGLPAEHLLRFYVTLGPETFEHDDSVPAAALSEVAAVLRGLGKIQDRKDPLPMTLAASARGDWKVASARN